MTDLIDEVREDIKTEQYNKIIRKIIYIFSASAFIALLTAGIYSWQENAANKMQRELSFVFNKSLLSAENNELDDSIAYLNKIIEHPQQEYAALAYLNKAEILRKQNKNDEAIKTLSQLLEHKHLNVAFRDLAELIILSIKFNDPEYSMSENNQAFSNLSKDEKPWKLLALQLKAIYQIKQHDLEGAKESLNIILNSDQANKSIKETSISILSFIGRINKQ